MGCGASAEGGQNPPKEPALGITAPRRASNGSVSHTRDATPTPSDHPSRPPSEQPNSDRHNLTATSKDERMCTPRMEAWGGEAPPDAQFRAGGPTLDGEVSECYDDLLFQVTTKGRVVAFYSDALDREVYVRGDFGPGSDVVPIDAAPVSTDLPGPDWLGFECTVFPGETVLFVRGDYLQFETRVEASPLSQGYRERSMEAGIAEAREALAAMKKAAAGEDFEDGAEWIDCCVTHGVPFVDESFMPSHAALQTEQCSTPVLSVGWRRPKRFLADVELSHMKPYSAGGAKPSDVERGELPDTALVSAMAAVAEKPELVHRLFAAGSAAERTAGAWHVSVCGGGWWSDAPLDDFLPCAGAGLAFSRGAKRYELWPPLLEKAAARGRGSYSALCDVSVAEHLTALTGFPAEDVTEHWVTATKTTDDAVVHGLFHELRATVAAGDLVLLSTPPAGESGPLSFGRRRSSVRSSAARFGDDAGLIPGHSYTVLDVKLFPERNVILVRLRTPWGSGLEWQGDYAASDSSWADSPDIARECKVSVHLKTRLAKGDGTFWMEWADLRRRFQSVTRCPCRSGWTDRRVLGTFDMVHPSVLLELHVRGPTPAVVLLEQADSAPVPIHVGLCTLSGPEYTLAMGSDDQCRGTTARVYKPSRRVGFQVELAESDAPQLLVPRVEPSKDLPAKTPFTLSLLTEAESSVVGVRFVKVAFNHPVLHFKKDAFAYDPSTVQETECRAQAMGPEGPLHVSTGPRPPEP